MISYLKGKLTRKDPAYTIIEVGGVGYEVKISLNTYSHIKDKDEILLHTYLHIREDAHILYGFFDSTERKCFLDLSSVNGMGASKAIMILSSLAVRELQAAILQEDISVLNSVKGVGTKTAQRIILELKDKLKSEGMIDKSAEFIPTKNTTLRNEALSALTTLGISKSISEKSIDAILKAHGNDLDLEFLIKLALKQS